MKNFEDLSLLPGRFAAQVNFGERDWEYRHEKRRRKAKSIACKRVQGAERDVTGVFYLSGN